MDESKGRIEVFAPFGPALDLTKLILLRPFDFQKWCVIGFAAFLAHLSTGGGSGFKLNRGFNPDATWSFRSATQEAGETVSGIPGWVFPLIGLGVLVAIVLVVVLLWLGARGRFIFTDCIVRNRGAIAAPWAEFKREGNSFFLFSLVAALLLLAVLGVAGGPIWLPFLMNGTVPDGAALVLGLSVFGLVALATMILWALISNFMIPVMYARRCNAMEGLRAAVSAITAQPGPVVLYFLFTIVLWVAFGILACLLTCLTCCIVAIPYVGTVILLPAYVFFMSYLLLFVRQFGPGYDAWANVVAVAPAAAQSIEPRPAEPPPPVQPPPASPPPATGL